TATLTTSVMHDILPDRPAGIDGSDRTATGAVIDLVHPIAVDLTGEQAAVSVIDFGDLPAAVNGLDLLTLDQVDLGTGSLDQAWIDQVDLDADDADRTTTVAAGVGDTNTGGEGTAPAGS